MVGCTACIRALRDPRRFCQVLGPDTDITAGGKIVIRIAGGAYLLVMPTVTQLISSESGLTIVSLSTDPVLLWHLSAEIKRQVARLKSVIQLQLDNNQPAGGQASDSSESSEDLKLKNLQVTPVSVCRI